MIDYLQNRSAAYKRTHVCTFTVSVPRRETSILRAKCATQFLNIYSEIYSLSNLFKRAYQIAIGQNLHQFSRRGIQLSSYARLTGRVNASSHTFNNVSHCSTWVHMEAYLEFLNRKRMQVNLLDRGDFSSAYKTTQLGNRNPVFQVVLCSAATPATTASPTTAARAATSKATSETAALCVNEKDTTGLL